VYGHRRRVAWRQVCHERSAPCFVPVVIREVSDAHLLTIGAQENLQRQDLDPVEEAQIVAWHERMYFDKNQAEIGAMLGKSSDWVSVRSRVHKLPDILKDRLRQRPRAVGQMLELGMYYAQQPSMAVLMADRVVNENLTVAAIRKLVRDAMQSVPSIEPDREGRHNRRVGATIVQDITSDLSDALCLTSAAEAHESSAADNQRSEHFSETEPGPKPAGANRSDVLIEQLNVDASSTDEATLVTTDLTLLQEAAAALSLIAARADALPNTVVTQQAIQEIEQALTLLRRALAS